jgi:hypothetical protein
VFQFAKGAPNLHLLWGWLQVGTVVRVPQESAPEWAHHHPHVANDTRTRNTLYISSDVVQLDTAILPLAGGGVFRNYDVRLQLTKAGENRSLWSLPAWFAPTAGRTSLGYHGRSSR